MEKALQEKTSECDEWKRKYEDTAAQLETISESVSAIVRGDLSKRITTEATEPLLSLKTNVNTISDQLNNLSTGIHSFSTDMSSGKFGTSIQGKESNGIWKEIIDDLNTMGSDLTGQIRAISTVTTAIAMGDLSKLVTANAQGELLELKNTINTMVYQFNSFASELTRLTMVLGTEGKFGVQADKPALSGSWMDLIDNANTMSANLTWYLRNIFEVTDRVANGDLSKKVTIDTHGELLETRNTINTMVDQLRTITSEVARLSQEMGMEGKLGGQARVRGLDGAWKDLIGDINMMAACFTGQIRGFSEVIAAIANGDSSKKITMDVSGELLELKNIVNTMVDKMNAVNQ